MGGTGANEPKQPRPPTLQFDVPRKLSVFSLFQLLLIDRGTITVIISVSRILVVDRNALGSVVAFGVSTQRFLRLAQIAQEPLGTFAILEVLVHDLDRLGFGTIGFVQDQGVIFGFGPVPTTAAVFTFEGAFGHGGFVKFAHASDVAFRTIAGINFINRLFASSSIFADIVVFGTAGVLVNDFDCDLIFWAEWSDV